MFGPPRPDELLLVGLLGELTEGGDFDLDGVVLDRLGDGAGADAGPAASLVVGLELELGESGVPRMLGPAWDESEVRKRRDDLARCKVAVSSLCGQGHANRPAPGQELVALLCLIIASCQMMAGHAPARLRAVGRQNLACWAASAA